MVHPVFDEILRAHVPIRPDVFARWQRLIRYEVIPSLAEAEDSAKPRPSRQTSKEATA